MGVSLNFLATLLLVLHAAQDNWTGIPTVEFADKEAAAILNPDLRFRYERVRSKKEGKDLQHQFDKPNKDWPQTGIFAKDFDNDGNAIIAGFKQSNKQIKISDCREIFVAEDRKMLECSVQDYIDPNRTFRPKNYCKTQVIYIKGHPSVLSPPQALATEPIDVAESESKKPVRWAKLKGVKKYNGVYVFVEDDSCDKAGNCNVDFISFDGNISVKRKNLNFDVPKKKMKAAFEDAKARIRNGL